MLTLEADYILFSLVWLIIVTILSCGTLFLASFIKNVLGYFSIAIYLVGSVSLFLISYSFFALLIVFFSIYQVINIARVIEARLSPENLRSVSVKTLSWLFLAQSLILVIWLFAERYPIFSNFDLWLTVILSLATAAGLLTFYRVFVWLERTEPNELEDHPSSDLPTISLLIPARNEDKDLTECIEAALASNYPKLEILVLDDCSSDKTPEIIRQYAQKGVRFIGGTEPKGSWLAKNQAYQRLADESSGEYLLFTGVDTRLKPNSITYAINYLISHKVKMISVMPRRGGQKIFGTLVQPMRYWLEFVGSKILDNRPPVLSTCWMIETKAFKKLGQLNAVKNSVNPEAYFAKQLSKSNQYYFVRANDSFGVITLKSIEQQIQTAIRTRYPSLNKRLELVPVLTLLYFAVLVGPFVYVLVGWNYDFGVVWMLAFIATVFLSIPHIILTVYSNPATWALSIISFPIVVFVEVVLMNISMWRYEFSEVSWKDRNICLPVMQAISELPKLDEPVRHLP